MKRFRNVLLLASIFLAGLLVSCGNNEPKSNNMSTLTVNTENTETTGSAETTVSTAPTETTPSDTGKMFYKDFVIDDLKSLEHIKKYDLNEFDSFFEGRMMNEFTDAPVLNFSKVNERFPVEIIRTGDYSVYGVKQGGYYYVFWDSPLEADGEPEVYFATYIASDRSPDLFKNIALGSSTAKDIKAIDPYCEISVLGSSPYIFSYINPDTAYLFGCQYQGGDHWESIVKSIMLVPREKTSCFSVIQSNDLP